MKNYYKLGLATISGVEHTPTRFENVNSAAAMTWRGMSRGKNARDLYRVGMDVIAHPDEQAMDVVGKVSILKDPMNSLTNLMVDIAHLLLMIGGLYLLAGAIWGGPMGRR